MDAFRFLKEHKELRRIAPSKRLYIQKQAVQKYLAALLNIYDNVSTGHRLHLKNEINECVLEMTYKIDSTRTPPSFVKDAYQMQTPNWCIEKYFEYLSKQKKTYHAHTVVPGGSHLYHYKFDCIPTEEENPQN